MMMKLT
jgi:hypothetical protein